LFGFVCFVRIHGLIREELDCRNLKCIFVGFTPPQKWYKCYHPPSQKCFVLMDGTFFELHPYFSSTNTSLQGESQSEEKSSMSSPLPIPTHVPEHDKQQSLAK
jgi:hypothetical protein